MRLAVPILFLAVVLAVRPDAHQPGQATPVKNAVLGGPGDQSLAGGLPVVATHSYRMAGKIRLLLPWIGPDNVGGARIVWRRGGAGERGWELLIGSDPERAPRRINRWGYIREEMAGGELSMLGVMKQSEERSLADAKRSAESESKTGYPYRLIRTRVQGGESSSVVTSNVFRRDFTYHDLPALLGEFESRPMKVSAPKQVRVGQATRPGFLVAVADLVHDCVYAFNRSGASALTARSTAYAYNGQVYDLKLERPAVLTNARYGDRSYARLLKGSFQLRNRAGGSSESFEIVWGVDGGMEEVPVYIEYQPRWWFKATLTLDEGQKF